MTEDLRLQIEQAKQERQETAARDFMRQWVVGATTAVNGTTRAGTNRTWVTIAGSRQPRAVWGNIRNENVDVLMLYVPGDELMIFATFLPSATDTWGESAPTVGQPPLDGRLLNIVIPGNRFSPGLVTLPSTIDGLHVFINGFEHSRNVFTSQQFLVTAPSSGSQAWIGIGVNEETNLPVQYLGQDRTLAYTPDPADALIEFKTKWADDDVPLAAILVANGATVLSSSNTIVDLRRKFSAAGQLNFDRILVHNNEVLTHNGNVLWH